MVNVELSWTDNSTKEDGYKVYRSTVGDASFSNDYTEIGSVSSNTTTYSDTSPPEVADVSYAVTAFDSVGESAPATSGTLDLRPQKLESIISNTDHITVSTSRLRVINDASFADSESTVTDVSNIRKFGSSPTDTESIAASITNIRELGSSLADTESIVTDVSNIRYY